MSVDAAGAGAGADEPKAKPPAAGADPKVTAGAGSGAAEVSTELFFESAAMDIGDRSESSPELVAVTAGAAPKSAELVPKSGVPGLGFSASDAFGGGAPAPNRLAMGAGAADDEGAPKRAGAVDVDDDDGAAAKLAAIKPAPPVPKMPPPLDGASAAAGGGAAAMAGGGAPLDLMPVGETQRLSRGLRLSASLSSSKNLKTVGERISSMPPPTTPGACLLGVNVYFLTELAPPPPIGANGDGVTAAGAFAATGVAAAAAPPPKSGRSRACASTMPPAPCRPPWRPTRRRARCPTARSQRRRWA